MRGLVPNPFLVDGAGRVAEALRSNPHEGQNAEEEGTSFPHLGQ